MATALFLVVGRIETFFDHGGRKCLAAYAHQYVRAQCGVVAVYESHGEVSAVVLTEPVSACGSVDSSNTDCAVVCVTSSCT